MKRWFLSFCSYDYVQDISNENRFSHLWGTTNSFTVYPLGQKKAPFLPDELWEEIKSLIYSESNSGKPPPPRRRQRLQCEPTHILRRGRSREKKGKQWRATIWRRQKHPELEREWLTKEFCPTSFSSPTSFWLRMLKGETSDSWKGLLYHFYHWLGTTLIGITINQSVKKKSFPKTSPTL